MILALCPDLFFAPKIRDAAQAAGLGFEILDQYKTTAEFLALLAERNPALIVLDLNSALPWPQWLPAAKRQPAAKSDPSAKATPWLATPTQAGPWLAYGSHLNPRRLAAARHAGADKVVPKSQFSAELPQLIAALVRK